VRGLPPPWYLLDGRERRVVFTPASLMNKAMRVAPKRKAEPKECPMGKKSRLRRSPHIVLWHRHSVIGIIVFTTPQFHAAPTARTAPLWSHPCNRRLITKLVADCTRRLITVLVVSPLYPLHTILVVPSSLYSYVGSKCS
jgi:hypothetical protein